MITKIEDKKNRSSIDAELIPIKTTFYGRMGALYGRQLLLRTYSDIVSLENPQKTWAPLDGVKVYDYEPVDIEIVVR